MPRFFPWCHHLKALPAPHSTLITSFLSIIIIIITVFSKLPHRLLASLHPVFHPLLYPAHLHFHPSSLADNPLVRPLPPPPSARPPAFHSHHHPLSSAFLPHSRMPHTDLLLFLLFPFLLLPLPSFCSPSLDVQPGKHREEKSEDAAEEADPKETSSTGPAGERAH